MLGWFYYYDRGPTGGDSAAYVVAIDFVAAVKKPGNDTATKDALMYVKCLREGRGRPLWPRSASGSA